MEHENSSNSIESKTAIRKKKARNMNLLVKAMRMGQLLPKGSKEHETASNSNESKRGIRERKQGT